MNDHESGVFPFRLRLRKAPSPWHRGLALGTLATHCAEAFDSELLPGRHHGIEPLLYELLDRLPLGVHLLADDLASLVLHQLRLREATGGLLLAATEDDRLRALARCDLGHGLLLHGLHCQGFHCGFGLHSTGLHDLLHSGLHRQGHDFEAGLELNHKAGLNQNGLRVFNYHAQSFHQRSCRRGRRVPIFKPCTLHPTKNLKVDWN